MEADAAKEMWGHSIEKNSMRYMVMLSDGDTDSYEAVRKMYGDGKEVTKEDCINHVHKRLSNKLKKLRLLEIIDILEADQPNTGKATPGRPMKGQKGKCPNSSTEEPKTKRVIMGGRGRLTESVIPYLVSYFQKAVRTAKTVDEMINMIMMSFEHVTSSDKYPQHQKCTKEFCFMKKYEAEVDEAYDQYKNDLQDESIFLTKEQFIASKAPPKPLHKVMKVKIAFEKGTTEYNKLEEVYKSLCDRPLLERCMRKLTQNQNESFHYRIWGYCPKVKYFSRPVMEFAMAQSILQYHKGYLKGYLVKELKIPTTRDMEMVWEGQERERIRLRAKQNNAHKKRKLPTKGGSAAYEAGGFGYPSKAPEQNSGRKNKTAPRARGARRGRSSSRRGSSTRGTPTLWDRPTTIRSRGRRSRRRL